MQFSLLSFLLGCIGFLPSSKHQLEINFNNIASDKGLLFVKIVDLKNQVVSTHTLKIEQQKVKLSVSLPSGKYAVSCFHDADNNAKLTTNFLGIPQERYGFSNNVRGKFGPPDLEDQLFQVNDDMNISITLN